MGREEITDENIRFLAQVYGWVRIPHLDMLSFRRKKTRINIWHDKWGTLTIGTALEHPVKGKTQLFRRGVRMKLLERILDYPRVHTGRGYQRKI